MASLHRVASLSTGVFFKPGLAQLCQTKRPYTALGVQLKNGNRKEEKDEFLKTEDTGITVVGTISHKEFPTANESVKPRLIDDRSPIDVKCNPTPSSSQAKQMWVTSARMIPWHSLVSMFNPNIQQSRNASGKAGDDCSKTENSGDCKPRKIKMDLPMSCVDMRKPPPPCEIPVQKKWKHCAKSMCLPCCTTIQRPLRCKVFDITLNTCPRKTYRIASYSECSKRYGRPGYKKECCYVKRFCYARKIAEREIKPLINIRDRQAMVLGFQVKF